MRKIITVTLLIICTQAHGQAFEGIIKWSVKIDITDTKMIESFKEMQKNLNEPAMQMLLMINPKFKEEMEPLMKMKDGDISSLMPNSMAYLVKEGETKTIIEVGLFPLQNFFIRKIKTFN